MDGWYYRVLGIEFGPVKLEKLIELAKSQSISRNDMVRFGLKSNWRTVGSMGQLMAHLPFEPNEKSFFANPYSFSKPTDASGVSVGQTDSTAAINGTTLNAQPEDPDRRWWCKIQDREYGPVLLSKVIEWANTGRLHRNDQIRFGQDPYLPAGEVQGLFPETKPPAPVTPSPTLHAPTATTVNGSVPTNGTALPTLGNSTPQTPPSFPQQKAS